MNIPQDKLIKSLAVLAALLFSLKSIFIKLAYNEGAEAIELLLFRMLFSAPVYLWLLMYFKYHKMSAKEFITLLGLGFSGYYLASYLDFRGLQYMDASVGRLVLFRSIGRM